MKFIVLKNNFKNGLDALSKIGSESNNTLPILKNFLIETVDNKLKLSATNLELAITSFVSGKVIEDGSITVPSSIFNSIINNIQSERINIENENNWLLIKTDNYEAKIQGIKKEEFPIIPEISPNLNLEINTNLLRDSLNSVSASAQFSETRPELNGVLFDFQMNILKLASTDSFRLAEKILNDGQFRSNINKRFKIIIPIKTIQEVVRVIKPENEDKVKIYFDDNQVLFKTDGVEIVSRLINSEFPDYQPIIPQESETEVSLNKEELINALKLTSSFTDRFNKVKILVKEGAKNIEVISYSQGLGENQYLIPAKIKGAPLEVVFNWRFLFDGLRVLNSESAVLGFNGDSKPIVIKIPNDLSFFYLLMPIKGE